MKIWYNNVRLLINILYLFHRCIISALQDLLEYKTKQRMLRIRMLDAAIKALNVDDSQTVGQLMVFICSKIGWLFSLRYLFPEC